MERRDILKYAAYASGAAICAPILTSLATGCQPEKVATAAGNGLHFFSDAEFSMLTKIVDVILPKTSSPSASEVGVDKMIDAMLGLVYGETEQGAFRSGFEALTQHLKSKDLRSELVAIAGGSDLNPSVKEAFTSLKQQSIIYYLSSETIGKNFLNYLPVPGQYEACIALDEVEGKAWAL